MTKDEQNELKEIEFYSANVNAWINSSFELDRNLLTLSAGGVALLLTLLTTFGVSSSEALVLYIVAMLSFLTCLISVLIVFNKNKSHIEQVLQRNIAIDTTLVFIDKLAIYSFGIGVLLSTIIHCCPIN